MQRGEYSVNGELTPTPQHVVAYIIGSMVGSWDAVTHTLLCNITFKTEVEGSLMGILGVNPEGRET